jgi:hypothetical protein
VQSWGGPRDLGDTITAAVLHTELGEYSDMLTQLGTEFYAEQQALALNGAQRFGRNLQNCGTTTVGETAGDENGCYWFRYDDQPSAREARAGFPVVEVDSFTIAQGIQKPRDDGWTVGVGFSFDSHRAHGYDGRWNSESKFFQLGASARREVGEGTLGATLQAGHNNQQVTRTLSVTTPVETQGNRSVTFLSNVLDYTHGFKLSGVTLEPSFSVGTSHLRFGDMTEEGAGPQTAEIHGGDETHLWAEPALGARYHVESAGGGSLRMFARVGLLHYFSGTSTKVRAGLEGAPDAARPMRIGSDLDRTHLVGEAGLQFESTTGFTFGLSYTHQESDIREGGAGSFRFVLPLR